MKDAAELAAALAFVVLLTILVTWPQALFMGSMIASHDDPQFSMWRLAWIAHALGTSPLHLLDGNIFYPAARTLTFSDATLLEGLIAAPALAVHVPIVLVYNTLLLAGFIGSGLAMFVLARRVTGAFGPALVAAAIFTMVPYRIEHFMHLELQWVMWVPLAFWAFHRAVEEGSWRFGVIGGLCLWLQIISCVYYGVFLAIALAILVPLLVITRPASGIRAIPGIALGLVAAAILTLPYAWAYIATSRALGPRDIVEVARYSARPINFFVTPPQNRLWGWTSARWGGPELSLYPGIVTITLAAIGLAWRRPRVPVLIYTVVFGVITMLSFGPRSRLYNWLLLHAAILQGLRSPSRFSIVADTALAVLAAFGFAAISERLMDGRARRVIWTALAAALIAFDFSNTSMIIAPQPAVNQAPVYRVVRSAGPGVLVDLPMPTAGALPGREAQYVFWSTAHWHPLVNGYSGYYTPEYIETLGRMVGFPDDESIARLKALKVRYLVVHRALYAPEQYTALLLQIANRHEIRAFGKYDDPIGEAQLFVLDQ